MTSQDKIAPCLWFDGNAEEVAIFYTSVFPDSRIDHVARNAFDTPGAAAGSVILVEFTLSGQRYQALNGGPGEPFNNAISLSVSCRDQAEVDRYWDALTAGGGAPIQCGWLQDKFGVRWQIVPDAFMKIMRNADGEKLARVMGAMMSMVKLDVAALERAGQETG